MEILKIVDQAILDPEYLAAKNKVRAVAGAIKSSTDPFVKRAIFVDGNEAIDEQNATLIRAQAKRAVSILQGALKPTRSNN